MVENYSGFIVSLVSVVVSAVSVGVAVVSTRNSDRDRKEALSLTRRQMESASLSRKLANESSRDSIAISRESNEISRLVSTSDFAASEEVKLEVSRLISTLRSMMLQGALYSTQDEGRRDSEEFSEYIDNSVERESVSRFLNSASSIGFYCLVWGRDDDRMGDGWRTLFLELSSLCFQRNPYLAARKAAQIELLISNIREQDILDVSVLMRNVPKVVDELRHFREKDPLVSAFFSMASKDQTERDGFDGFVSFLVRDKDVKDPDVLLFYSVVCGDPALAEHALGEGADLAVRSGEIVTRYRDLYDDFVARTNKF